MADKELAASGTSFVEGELLQLDNPSKNPYVVKPILNALHLLEVIGETSHDVKLTELAVALRWPKTTVFRYLQTLSVAGFVRHDVQRDRYGVGPRLRMFAQQANSLHQLRQLAIPVMEKLSKKFALTINLGVSSGMYIVYIEMIEGNRPAHMEARIGERHPMVSTALGQAILAFLPEGERAAVIDAPAPKMTLKTINNTASLRSKLSKIKKDGFALELEETEDELGCIGVPILDKDAYPIASLSLSAPVRKLGPDAASQMSLAMIAAARKISKEYQELVTYNPE